MNRKLIRPNLGEIKEKLGRHPRLNPTDEKPSKTGANDGSPKSGNAVHGSTNATQSLSAPRRKIAPPEQTNAESFYYLKQMQAKTQMVVVLQDGEKIRGVIEWYDKHCLKVNRVKEPNILLPKHNIKYMFKQEEEPRMRRSRSDLKLDDPIDSPEVEALSL
jgi:sRNA-binding regulator protein Hfq